MNPGLRLPRAYPPLVICKAAGSVPAKTLAFLIWAFCAVKDSGRTGAGAVPGAVQVAAQDRCRASVCAAFTGQG